jgi:hypothetical protein
VIWKLLLNTPRIVATLITSSSVHSLPASVAGIGLGDPLLLDEHHRHRTTEVLARRVEHLRCPASVELDVHRGLSLGEARACVHELLARRDHLALEQHRAALAGLVEPGTQRRAAEARGLCGVVLVIHEAELEGGRGTEHAQRLVRVLHAGQLHGDPVDALARDDRLGHAEFVHPVAQRRDVLLDREVLALLHLVRRESHRHRAALTERARLEGHVRILPAQGRGHLVHVGAGAQ